MYLLIYLFIDIVHLLIYNVFFFLPSFPFYIFIYIYIHIIYTYVFISISIINSFSYFFKNLTKKKTETLSWTPVMFLSFSHPPTLSVGESANADLLAVQHAAHRHLPCCRGDGCDLVSQTQTGGGFPLGFFGWMENKKTQKSWKKMTFSWQGDFFVWGLCNSNDF